MTRILITGGAGFIGQHLVKRLLQCEGRHSVIVIDNLSRFNNKGFSKIVINKSSSSFGSAGSYVFYKVDLRNKKRIYDIIRRESIDLCIHLAALVSVPQSIKNPIETMDVNINGTLNLLEVCWQNKVRNFIFASSAAVYGKNSLMPLKEHLPLEPLSPYGVSKVAGEALVSLYKNSEKIRNTLSLRIFNVYGRGQNNSYAGVITKFANRLTRKLAPVIYGDGKQKRDFISVHDVVQCMILAVNAQENGNMGHNPPTQRTFYSPVGVLNVGTGRPLSIISLAKKMIKMSGLDLKPIYINKWNKGEAKYSYADTSRAWRYLKFKAEENLEQGLKQLLQLNPNI
jgi:UDP-glucose 4-epimerase